MSALPSPRSNVTAIRSAERPESLRTLLDRGDDIEEYYRRWSKADDVFGALLEADVITTSDPEGRARSVEWSRGMVDQTVVARGEDCIGGEKGRRALIIAFSWKAELLEDRALFEQLLAVAPAEAVATYHEERAEADAPAHPLRAERPSAGTRCDSCGEVIEGLAVTAEDIECALWCVACIEGIAARARARVV